MPAILVPTRGGEASQPNQDYAIELAKRRGLDLLFLYVSNVSFMKRTASPFVVDIEGEIEEMGEFLLTMAQERAEKAGVKAKMTVRQGRFRRVLKKVIAEHHIGTVVLGSAARGSGITTLDYLTDLGEELSERLEVEFIVVQEGQVIKKYEPSGGQQSGASQSAQDGE
jgi:nucleotide-binding universal stress UspA family protein